MTNPSCPWCRGAGYLCEDNLLEPWDELASASKSAGINCPVCNPYGTAAPLTDAEMDAFVSRPPQVLGQ